MRKFSKKNFIFHSVARRFVFCIVVFVTIFTMLEIMQNITAYKKNALANIEDSLISYETSQIPIMAEKMRAHNYEQLSQEIKLFKELRFVEYVEIMSDGEIIARAGNEALKSNVSDVDVISRHSSIRSITDLDSPILGELTIIANVESIYSEMAKINLRIFILKIVETFFLALIVIILFYYLVGRHLVNLSYYANELNLGRLNEPLKLKRNIFSSANDEIGRLYGSINDMRENLQVAYDKNLLTEREREKLLKKMQEKNAELERFTYTVSHDLKTPLVTISGYIGMLEEDIKMNDKEAIHEDIGTIKNASTTMYKLLEDLLELSRIGAKQCKKEVLNFNTLVTEVMSVLSVQINSRHAVIELQKSMPIVEVEKVRFKEVFLNLIENALKYMAGEPSPLIEIGTKQLQKDNGEYETAFFIRDNGQGINPDYCDKIFDLFERIDLSVEGTGVGLSIVSRIIEAHEGRIWAESEGEGKGSTFYFVIPLLGENAYENARP